MKVKTFLKRDRVIDYLINALTDDEFIDIYSINAKLLIDRQANYYKIAHLICKRENLFNTKEVNRLWDELNIEE
jgi:hypothetical protein